MLAYLNGEFLPLERAHLHVSDLSIQRGFGIFDFFRIREFVPLYLDSYLDRFFHSAIAMGLPDPPERAALRSVILELIRRNKVAEAGMKVILTGGYSPDAYQPVKGNLIVSQHALILPSVSQVERGIKVITYPYRRDIPEVKTINYTMGVWLQKKVKEAGAADVLYHQDGIVSEFPRCNFFLVTRQGVVVTPHQFILHGITRKRVLESASAQGEVQERAVTLREVYDSAEVFLTTKDILPIIQVDDHVIGSGKPGPVTMALRELLKQAEQREIARSAIGTASR
jgi:D-alanine transaminase/branched-chain amino acid aminotransferase